MVKSTVIKSSEPGEAIPLASVFSLSDIARQAENILAAAKTRGDHILAEARARAEKTTAAAHKKGYDDGYANGRTAGETHGRTEALVEGTKQFAEQAGTLVEALKKALADLDGRKLRIIADAQHDQLALAQRIAEKVTRLRVRLDGESARANLDAAIRHVAGRSNVTVSVNPADLESIQTFADDLIGQIDGLETIDVRDDPAVSRGGCVVRYGVGKIDATIETQLELIARQLLGVEAPQKPTDGVRGVSSEMQQ